jgi:hypothetical protein
MIRPLTPLPSLASASSSPLDVEIEEEKDEEPSHPEAEEPK